MSMNRSEMTIPVRRDARTFEQRREDMLTNLERRTSTRLGEQPSRVLGDTSEATTASSVSTDTTGHRSPSGFEGHWEREVDRWVGERRRRWNDEIRRMRQDMFALEPVDDFAMDHWTGMDAFGPHDDHSSMVEKMERQIQSLRKQMDIMPGFGPPRFTSSGGSSIQSSSSRITTSKTSSSTGDPLGTKTQSNTQESVQHSRTVNGVTTSTSSHSSTSSKSTGAEPSSLTEAPTPGALLPQTSVPGGMMDFLKDAYELDEDGQLHFKVRFNAKDFSPEDIDVTTVENHLTVHAKKAIKTSGSENLKEFCRTIDLPRSIDHEHFQCSLTEDGVLILDAPVKAPDYQSITFDKDHHLSIRPKAEAELRTSSSSTSTATLIPLGHPGPTILRDGTSGRKLHLEVPVDSNYRAEDLSVRMDANRIIVSGKKESSTDTRTGPVLGEFSQSYDIPETVDPFSVTAQLTGNTLIIEAPLLCTV